MGLGGATSPPVVRPGVFGVRGALPGLRHSPHPGACASPPALFWGALRLQLLLFQSDPPFPPFLTRSFSTWACHSPPGPFFPLLSPAPGSGASFMCRWRSVPEPEGGLSRGDKCVSSHGGPGQCIARTLKGRWGICLMTDPRVSLR